MKHILAMGFTVILLSACDPDGDGRYFETTESCRSNSDDRSYLIEQLESLGIRYSIDAETQCVKFSSEGVSQLQLTRPAHTANLGDIYPENFAPGRSASWGERNHELIAILEESDIDHDTYFVYDTEWVSWNLADVEKVEESLGYSELERQNNKVTREYFAEFNSPTQ